LAWLGVEKKIKKRKALVKPFIFISLLLFPQEKKSYSSAASDCGC
jgi:hypothetical protein